MQLAMIGLGRMGAHMTTRLLLVGSDGDDHAVVVCNRGGGQASILEAAGVR